jgi:hypothetical protein
MRVVNTLLAHHALTASKLKEVHGREVFAPPYNRRFEVRPLFLRAGEVGFEPHYFFAV